MDERAQLTGASRLSRTWDVFRVVFFILSIIFLASSLFFLGTAAMQYKGRAEARETMVAAEATVRGPVPGSDAASGASNPMVEAVFTLKDGSEYTVALPVHAESVPSAGTVIPVRYPAENPSLAKVDDFANFYLLPTMVAALGCMVLLLGIVFFIAYAILCRHRRR